MADFYTFNEKNSLERTAIEGLLEIASNRIAKHPEALPFKSHDGALVIGWLRGLLDRKPSEIGPS